LYIINSLNYNLDDKIVGTKMH